jgi:predicted cobalt transporter CbtA
LELCTTLEELTIEINGGDRSLLRVDGIRNGLCGLRRMRRFAFLGLDPADPASPAAPLSKHSMQT